ncbi:Ig-like domain-containing protein [Haladaptatus cibarius]|uniref:Ig-like domain-containing protein n=1 Tax=Haladaptatus cibarius TaxID=453847 RepID=UPI0006792D35|nr:Ig-like domain-containing protein [Haladaptatus cibarius]
MTFWADERGVTVQVGTILLFATLIVAMSVYQATAIPSQNAEIEFRHNEELQGQMQDVRNAVIRTSTTGTSQPTSITLGTQYPSRMFFINPPPSSGTLRTTDLGAVGIENVTARAPETADYLDSSQTNLSFSTRALVYAPNYNQYGNAPDTVLENTVIYNRAGEGNATLTGQQLVQGRSISLVTLDGSLSKSQSTTASIDPRALSPSTTETRSIPVESTGNGNVTVRISTGLGEEKWNDLLADQIVSKPGGYVADVSVENGILRLTLLGTDSNGESVTYDLRMAKVGVGSETSETNATYITNVSGGGGASVGEPTTLVAEVRDRYNNPVSGVRVNASGGVTPTSARTDEQGRVRFSYTADTPGTETVMLAIDDGSEERERVNFEIEATAGGGAGGTYDVEWIAETGLDCDDEFTVCVLNRSQRRGATLTADVTYGGEPVTDTAVDFGLNQTGIITTTPNAETTDSNGRVETEIRASETGTVRLFAASGGDADPVVIRVTQSGELPGIVYNEDATPTRGNRGGGPQSGFEFSVTNQLPEDVTLTDVRIDPQDTSIDVLSDPSTGEGRYESELHVEAESDGTSDVGNGVSLPATIDIDRDGQQFSYEAPLRQEPRIGGDGGTATFYLYQFERNENPVGMTNEAVDITLYFEDHDPVEFTVNEQDGDGGDGNQPSANIEYVISDTSRNNNARYQLSYDVTETNDFDRLEVRYNNLDENYDAASGRYETTDSRGKTNVFTAGGTMGDDYEIVLTAYDASGNVLGEERVTDTVDGQSPPGDDLSTPSSPQVQNVDIRDRTNVRQDEGRYQVFYDVSNSGTFDAVEVEFRNLDNEWATETETAGQRNGNIWYRRGGTARDDYEIIVRVLDGDGIVVDTQTITDTADDTDP